MTEPAKQAAPAAPTTPAAPPPRPRSRLRRFLFRSIRLTFRFSNWLFSPVTWAVLLALILGDLYLETAGLPDGGVEIVRAALVRRGLVTDIGQVRIGLLNGVALEQVTLYDGRAPGHVMAEIDSLELTPNVRRLASGDLRPRRMRVRGLILHYPCEPRDTTDLPPRLPPARLDADLRLRGGRLQVSSLAGEAGGLRIHLSGVLRHIFATATPASQPPEFRTAPPPADLLPPLFGWETLLERTGPDTHARLAPLLRAVARDGLPQADGTLNLRFDVSLTDPADGSAWGALSLADVRLRGVDVRKLRTGFVLQDRRLRLHQLVVHVIGDQTAAADLQVDLVARQVSGRAEGILNPEVALRLLGRPVPGFLTEMRFGAPVRFHADLRPSAWRADALDAEIRCESGRVWYRDLEVAAGDIALRLRPGARPAATVALAGARWRDVPIAHVSAHLTEAEEGYALRDVTLELDRARRERIEGTVQLFAGGTELALEARGSLHPATLLRLLPEAPPQVAEWGGDLVIDGEPPSFACRVERSPLDPLRWTGSADLRVPAARFRDLPVHNARCSLSLRDSQLSVTHQAVFGTGDRQSLDLEAQVDLARRTVAGRVTARLLVDQLYCALRLPQVKALERLTHMGEPATVSAELERSTFDPRQWVVHGRLEATSATYGGVAFRQAACAVELNPGSLRFRGIAGDTEVGDRLTGDIRVELPSGVVTIDALIRGDPRLVRAFLGPRSGAKYLRIWEGFEWDPAHPVEGRITGLCYDSSRGSDHWLLTGRVDVATQQATWHGTRTDAITTTLVFDLPKAVHVEQAEACIGNAQAEGEAHLFYQDPSLCQFRLSARSDPRLVLRLINPVWETPFAAFTFPEDTQIECEGGFYLGVEARPRVRGRVTCAASRYRATPLEAFSLKWQLEDDRISWTPLSLQLHGGRVMATGAYDFFADAGDLTLSIEGVGLGPLLAGGKGMGGGAMEKGLLSGNARLALLRPRRTEPAQFTGSGRLWVQDADLWRLPLLDQLGKLMGMMSLGQITRVDADLVFAGDHVQVPRFQTDGTIFALQGQGQYAWADQAVAFTVRGEALKTTRIVPMLLKPLFWFFEAELSGTTAEPEWRMVRGLTKMFSGD